MNKLYKYIVYITVNFLLLFLAYFSIVKDVFADQYGQGVILGDAAQIEIVHATVDAGISETILIVGISFILLSILFYLTHNKLNKLQV